MESLPPPEDNGGTFYGAFGDLKFSSLWGGGLSQMGSRKIFAHFVGGAKDKVC